MYKIIRKKNVIHVLLVRYRVEKPFDRYIIGRIEIKEGTRQINGNK